MCSNMPFGNVSKTIWQICFVHKLKSTFAQRISIPSIKWVYSTSVNIFIILPVCLCATHSMYSEILSHYFLRPCCHINDTRICTHTTTSFVLHLSNKFFTFVFILCSNLIVGLGFSWSILNTNQMDLLSYSIKRSLF